MAVGWALLGTGRHADRNVMPEMRKAADTKLVAVLSRDRDRGEAFALKHGFAKVYTSLEELLRDQEIDAVYDATPDGLHMHNTLMAAAAGKHSLVEKPLAIAVKECIRSIQVCRQHGVKLGVVFQRRHEAVHQEARRMVLAGEIGDVVLARVQLAMALAPQPQATTTSSAPNWRSDPAMRPGGMVMGSGDHAYDTLAYITGQQIVEVAAFTDSTRHEVPNEGVAAMLLKLSGGAAGYAVTSRRTPYGQEPFVVHGTKGSLALYNTYGFMVPTREEDPRPRLEVTNDKGRTVRVFEPTECIRLEVEQFNRFIQGKEEPMTTAREGLVNQAVTEAVYESARSGRVVRVAQFVPEIG